MGELNSLIVIAIYTCFAWSQVTETQTANSIAKKALTEANKPYVMFTSLVPNYTSDAAGRHFRVGITWTNLGNTPASYVRINNCDPIIREDTAEPQLHCNVSESKDQIPENVIGPKQQLTVIGPILKESDFDDTQTEKKAIYILGYATYQDAIDVDQFGNPEQRETRFCQRIVKPTIEAITTSALPTLQNAPPATPPAVQVLNPPKGAPITAMVLLGCRRFTCIDKECGPLN